jgi:general stress protein YciG
MAERGKRGFAVLDREKQRRIASLGGKAAHRKGTAHQFTSEEAREAGRKGGRAAHQKGTAHRFTHEEAQEAGRRGRQRAQDLGRFPEVPGAESSAEATLASEAEAQVLSQYNNEEHEQHTHQESSD